MGLRFADVRIWFGISCCSISDIWAYCLFALCCIILLLVQGKRKKLSKSSKSKKMAPTKGCSPTDFVDDDDTLQQVL